MSTVLATKQELPLATREDLLAIKDELRLPRHEVWLASLDRKFDRLRDDIRRDFAELELRLTIKLGAMMLVGFSLLLAGLWTLTH